MKDCVFTFRPKYGLWAIILFGIEVLIAVYVHDSFIRPFVGDYLVVFLMYCFAFTFLNVHFTSVATAVLLLCYLVETLQYFQFLHLSGLDKYSLLTIVLGSSFSWYDILAYTLGFLTILFLENRSQTLLRNQTIYPEQHE